MSTLFLKPAAGLIVPDPITGKPLEEDGEVKPDTTYWRRRLRDNDVVCAARPQMSPQPKGGKSK